MEKIHFAVGELETLLLPDMDIWSKDTVGGIASPCICVRIMGLQPLVALKGLISSGEPVSRQELVLVS